MAWSNEQLATVLQNTNYKVSSPDKQWQPLTDSDNLPTEIEEQIEVFKHIRTHLALFPTAANIHAVENEAHYSAKDAHALAKYRRKCGILPGIPDICAPEARGRWFSLRIEMKRTKKWHITEIQKERIRSLNAQGNLCVVAIGAQPAIQFLNWWYFGLSPVVLGEAVPDNIDIPDHIEGILTEADF